MAACASCGHHLGVGRFCTNCGHRVDHSQPMDIVEPPVEPSVEPAVAPTPSPLALEPPAQARYPLFADGAVQPSPSPSPPITTAAPADPAPEWSSRGRSGPARSRRAEAAHAGWLPWAAGAAGLILFALIGALLLVTGDDEANPGADDRSGDTTSDPASDPAGDTASDPAPPPSTSDEPARPDPTESLPAGTDPLNLVRYAMVEVPATAAPNVDVSGNEVRYDAANMLDEAVETCWRMPGSGADEEIVFTFEAPVELTEVGLINGYAKTSGDFDWYKGNRRVLAVEWVFDDGTVVEQTLEETRKLQSLPIRSVTTTAVTLRLTGVSDPGLGRSARDYTAISDVSLVGVPS